MRELYTLELMQLVEELQSFEGYYIDQFYELEKNRFRLKLSNRGEKANLQIVLPYSINRSNTIEIKEEASGFSMAVRKRISGAKIINIRQFNNDRIIIISLEKTKEQLNLIFEMFGKGNFVISDSAMKITLAYQLHVFKDRAIRPGSTYAQPKNSSINPFDKEAVASLIKEMSEEDVSILPHLTKRLGIGKVYVEEVMTQSGLPATARSTELKGEKLKVLTENTIEIIINCTKKPEIMLYKKDGAPFDFALCEISKYSSFESQKFESLENCLDFMYQGIKLAPEGKNEEEEATKASIDKQKEFLEGIGREIQESKSQGDYIMNNMHKINELINLANSKKNPIKEDLQQGSHNVEVLNVNTKTKIIKIKTKDSETDA